jgi:hypothetical protein
MYGAYGNGDVFLQEHNVMTLAAVQLRHDIQT